MPIKYIGRTTDFKGKTLWEILGNLKNFGVGRMVIRNRLQRYPEPCYMRILKVAALPKADDIPGIERKVIVLVERTFRGVTVPKPVQIDSTTYKSDYMLIPKDQEAMYLSRTTESPALKIFPRTLDLPPLFKYLTIRNAENTGTPIMEEPKMKAIYNFAGVKNYRIAEDGETPTEKIPLDIGTPVSPSLYENIQN